METHCLRQNEIPGTSRLFLDYLYHFDRLGGFYSHPPYDPDSYARAAAEIEYPDSRREALIEVLRKTNDDSPALEKLAQPGTVAVVTGQQVGLFSGPAFTIYKALTAAKLAEALSARGIRAVPVFWLATEDHDFEEVNHVRIFSDSHQAVALRATGDGISNQPVGTIRLASTPTDELTGVFERFPSGAGIASIVREVYRPGVSLGSAFHHLISKLLTKFGLLYLDPLDPDIRQIGAPFLREAVAAAPGLNRSLRERSQELTEAGYHAQVLVEEDTSLLFRIEGNRRVPFRLKNGGLATKECTYSPRELAASPTELSPNALLRPVFQDFLLPTIAYVGGAAELAYLAQSQLIYRELLGRMPVVLARAGFTIIDERSHRQMERYRMPLTSFFAPVDTVREQIANRLVPPSLSQRYAEARNSQRSLLEGLRKETLAFDPTLAKAVDKSKAKIEYQLARIERKVARETLRRDAQARSQSDALTALLYPEKHLQERYYSILPFLAEHGTGLLDDLYANIHFDCPDHKILIP